jgi:hypothetical protein
MSTLSTFLFARPSFAEGFARALDIGCTLDEYNKSSTFQLADLIAMAADWRAVGEDIRAAGLEECRRLLQREGQNVECATK